MSGSAPSPEPFYESALRMALWGDSRAKILKRLQVNGLSDSQASLLCDQVFVERARSIRQVYLPKIVLGGGLFVVSGVFVFICFLLSEGFLGVRGEFLVLPASFCAWGVVQLVTGVSGWMSAPHREGPVADLE